MDMENIDIRAWAQQIHEIKIRELKEKIKKLQSHYNAIKDVTYANATTDLYMHFNKTTTLTDLAILNLKLDLLVKDFKKWEN